MSKSKEERDAELVVVYPAEKLEQAFGCEFVGVHETSEDHRHTALLNGSFLMKRGLAEENPYVIQIIPYVLVYDRDGEHILTYTRDGGEVRLHGDRSLGWGGHMNDICWVSEAQRELQEEVGLEEADLTKYGYIFCPTNEVGRVHLGILATVETEFNHNDEQPSKEEYGEWWHVDDIAQKLDQFELWSQLAFAFIHPEQTRNATYYK